MTKDDELRDVNVELAEANEELDHLRQDNARLRAQLQVLDNGLAAVRMLLEGTSSTLGKIR